MSSRLFATVSGMVQGVGFRAWVQREALRWELTGYAKNLSDGSVEVVAEGPEHLLHQLVSKLEQGPPMSHVDCVDWRIEPGGSYYSGFETGP